jgi:hypothetical protein
VDWQVRVGRKAKNAKREIAGIPAISELIDHNSDAGPSLPS